MKLLRKFMTLTFLLVVLGFLFLANPSSSGALPCCRDCIAEEEACYQDCYDVYGSLPNQTEETAAQYEACNTRCFQMGQACAYTPCTNNCQGQCTDSSECGPGCQCTGIRCVCF